MNLPTARERVQSILAQRITRFSNGQSVIQNLPSHESIATMANTSRETVSRIIGSFVKEGILEKDPDRKSYFVKKSEELKDLTK